MGALGKGARAVRPGRIVGEQLRVVSSQGCRARAGRQDHVVEAGEGLDHLAGEGARLFTCPLAECRLATAGLLGRHADPAAGALEQAHGREADAGPEQVDQTGDEQADVGRGSAHDAQACVARLEESIGIRIGGRELYSN
jgi:hypothetical protein